MFSSEKIAELRLKIQGYMTPKRYAHTLEVAKMAVEIGEALIPEMVCELECAALLHDIAKDMPKDDLISCSELSSEDFETPAVLHSLLAPEVIKRDFAEFATENILSAVRKHTTGDDGMSVFDEIIFLSDYIEKSRTYISCVETRNFFFEKFLNGHTMDEKLLALHRAVYKSLENTVSSLKLRNEKIHYKTILTLNYISSII